MKTFQVLQDGIVVPVYMTNYNHVLNDFILRELPKCFVSQKHR